MESHDLKLEVDDDPEFDDSDLYDTNETVSGGEPQSQQSTKNEKLSSHPEALDRSDMMSQSEPMNGIQGASEATTSSIRNELNIAKVEESSTHQSAIDFSQGKERGGESNNSTEEVVMSDTHDSERPSTALGDGAAGSSNTNGHTLTFDRDFIEAARANRGDPEAEFEEDSDPEISDDSTDSDSDDSSSDDDSSDDDDDSLILDPAEAARMLMRASSPDEGGAGGGPPRTANEQQEKPLDIPVIANINEIGLVELGHISHRINDENCAVIKATVHANHNVLQPGSALCLADRTLIRPISDTIAQVQEPYYVVYFESAEEMDRLGVQDSVKVFYLDHPDHRAFVFYEELRKQKFTDASNINDEEVDEREIEFSDDEQEAAYRNRKKEEKKKQQKQQQRKNAEDGGQSVPSDQASQHSAHRGRGGGGPKSGRGRGPRGRGRGGRGGWQDYDSSGAPQQGYAPLPATQPSGALDYGDDGSDGYYRKLRRPNDYGTWQNTPQPQPQPQSEPQAPVSYGGAYNAPPQQGGFPSYGPQTPSQPYQPAVGSWATGGAAPLPPHLQSFLSSIVSTQSNHGPGVGGQANAASFTAPPPPPPPPPQSGLATQPGAYQGLPYAGYPAGPGSSGAGAGAPPAQPFGFGNPYFSFPGAQPAPFGGHGSQGGRGNGNGA
ncbi:uncharacterized protein PV09_03611 [Verruconis gallopava]|uniref:Uncharacterized protein n=1 Tax=Verruconis gallopava TaxID=253628 RepID=A0A0D2AGP2_9PEZI|nr:uncharacterized protein PV09_03611 [Verruconis gallopava]KIW05755.1 hypothetical protein PV09_03611 [Verruconis gallopava]